MMFKFRTDDLCLIIDGAGVLALLVILEVVFQDGANFRHEVSMRTVAAAIGQADGTLVFRGPDDKIVVIEIGGDARNFDKVDVGRTLNVESARFRGRVWSWRDEGSQDAYAIDR